MGCKRTTVAIIKRIAAEVTPVLVQTAVGAVKTVEIAAEQDPAFLTNEVKRKIVGDTILAQAKRNGLADLKQRTVNLITEFAVEAVKGDDDENELGMDDLATRVEI